MFSENMELALWETTASLYSASKIQVSVEYSGWRHNDVLGNQLVYIKSSSAQSIYSGVRLHVSTRG